MLLNGNPFHSLGWGILRKAAYLAGNEQMISIFGEVGFPGIYEPDCL